MAEIELGRKKRSKNRLFEDLSKKDKSEPVEVKKEVAEVKEVKPTPPPVEKETTQRINSFEPLTDQPVNEKAYTLNEMNPTQITNETTGEIPEQHFEAPPIDESANENTIQDVPYDDMPSNEGGGNNSGDNSEGVDDFGGNTSDLPANEKKIAAKQLAEYLLRSYQAYVPKIYKKIGKISDKKIHKLEDEGKINTNLKIKKRDNSTCTIKQQIDSANEGIENAFNVSDEWVEDVRPPVERILMKRDIGITDEGYVLLKVAEHNINCITTLVSIKKDFSDFLDFAKDLTAQYNVNNIKPSKIAPEPVKVETQQEAQPQPQQQQTEDIQLAEVVDEGNVE